MTKQNLVLFVHGLVLTVHPDDQDAVLEAINDNIRLVPTRVSIGEYCYDIMLKTESIDAWTHFSEVVDISQRLTKVA